MFQAGHGTQKDMHKANFWWRLSAKQGCVFAKLNLGFSYLLGEGVIKNPRSAKKWFRLAAQQSSPEAFKILREIAESEK